MSTRTMVQTAKVQFTPEQVYGQREELVAHCRRVAAVAAELGAFLDFSAQEQNELRRVALLHHAPAPIASPGFDRLIRDVFGFQAGTPRLALVEDQRVAKEEGIKHDIVELANAFDEQMEFLPFDDRFTEQVMAEFAPEGGPSCWTPEARKAFRELKVISSQDLIRAAAQIPVFPKVAWRALRLLRDENASLGQIAEVASCDQVITASLLRVANSGLYGRSEEVRSVDRALARVGLDMARKAILALSARPMFASAKLQHLWKHSVEVAESAAVLAQRIGLEPDEAFAAGLMHDIGRLILERVPVFAACLYTGLIEKGCPAVYAERLLAGCDHGAMGADLLLAWQLPADLAAGIRNHHRPELQTGPLAAVLYLAEWKTGDEEDLPSEARLHMALDQTEMRLEDLEDARPQSNWLAVCA